MNTSINSVGFEQGVLICAGKSEYKLSDFTVREGIS